MSKTFGVFYGRTTERHQLVLSLEHELERLQRSDAKRNRERERDLEDKLEEREHELRDLRRRKYGIPILSSLELERVKLTGQAESLEQNEIEELVAGWSESRSLLLEEREERKAVEEDLYALRDRLAAVIELQEKEDEIEVKSKESI